MERGSDRVVLGRWIARRLFWGRRGRKTRVEYGQWHPEMFTNATRPHERALEDGRRSIFCLVSRRLTPDNSEVVWATLRGMR